MKKEFALSLLCLLIGLQGFSQMRTDILPQSKMGLLSGANIPEIVLPRFPLAEIQKLDQADQQSGRVPKVTRDILTHINPQNSGEWSYVANGRVWRVQITSREALALNPLFDSLYLPEGSTLHFYTPGNNEMLGAFTNINTPQIRSFSCGLIQGESFIIEYYEPATETGRGIINLYRVGFGYRRLNGLGNLVESAADTSIDCQVNVICPEGDNWRDQVRSAVQIFMHTDAQNGANLCSGALVNNTSQDGTPYILSAMHCLEGITLPSDFGEFVFTFHFQDSLCQGPDPSPPATTINGCTKIATSNDNNGQTGSDFLLLEMSQKPNNADSAFYAGWFRGPATPQSGVCIHHPGGGPKKISTYGIPAASVSWGNIVPGTHWSVTWDTSMANHGITGDGSSGSPLFNQNGLIVGHLTGGASCCIPGTCDGGGDQWGPDSFGKLFFDWDSNGVDSNEQLMPWLDPDNTGTTALAGASFLTSAISALASNSFFMQLMPNPTGGSFKITFNTTEEKTIRIFDALGRSILNRQSADLNVSFDLSAYSKGIYIVEAENKTGNSVQKLVLN